MSRSTAYWETNLYREPRRPPLAAAPADDLPADAAVRFRALRTGLRAIAGVKEQPRFVGQPWRWAWEYSMEGRRLCWVHCMEKGVSVTFTLSSDDEERAADAARLPAAVQRAIREGQRTGPVRWCWLELSDRRSVDAMLGFARKKAVWLAA